MAISCVESVLPRRSNLSCSSNVLLVFYITCSTDVLHCYRRQAIPMEQAKIRPSVTLYSLDRSLYKTRYGCLVHHVGDPYSDAKFSYISL